MRRTARRWWIGWAAAVVASGCGTAAGPSGRGPTTTLPAAVDTTPHAVHELTLGVGTVQSFPPGVLFPSIISVTEQPGDAISHSHGAGFVYVTRGAQTLDIATTGSREIERGEAAFTPADTPHTHRAAGASEWLFLGIRPTAQRGTAPVAGSRIVYAGPDLPQLPEAPVVEKLELMTVEAGGGAPVAPPGGTRSLVDLEGRVVVVGDVARPPVTLSPGTAVTVPAGSDATIHNGTDAPAVLLSFSVVTGMPTDLAEAYAETLQASWSRLIAVFSDAVDVCYTRFHRETTEAGQRTVMGECAPQETATIAAAATVLSVLDSTAPPAPLAAAVPGLRDAVHALSDAAAARRKGIEDGSIPEFNAADDRIGDALGRFCAPLTAINGVVHSRLGVPMYAC